MLTPLLGSIDSERALIFILAREKGYPTEIASFFDTNLYGIQKQLDKLEAGQVVVSQTAGRTRLYTFNPRLSLSERAKEPVRKGPFFLSRRCTRGIAHESSQTATPGETMIKHSAGLLLYRKRQNSLEVFLVHPGGPFWAKKDLGSWSIPKGEFEQEESLLAAKREFFEETGLPAPQGTYMALAPVRQKGGKSVHAWAVEAEVDAGQIRSNSFEMEWPPRSGKRQTFPEIDRGAWFPVHTALEKINPGQAQLIRNLLENLTASGGKS